MAAITGFSKDEVTGHNLVDEYISDEFKNSVREVLANALLGVQTDNYQLPLFTKDSKRVELLLNAATRCDASGEIVGVVGVGQDIVRRPVSIPRPQHGEGAHSVAPHARRPRSTGRRPSSRASPTT